MKGVKEKVYANKYIKFKNDGPFKETVHVYGQSMQIEPDGEWLLTSQQGLPLGELEITYNYFYVTIERGN